MKPRPIVIGVGLMVLLSLVVQSSFAQGPAPAAPQGAAGILAAGDLDPTFGGFGSLGKVLVDIGASDPRANAVGIQADGRLVVAGSAFQNADSDFVVARYHPDGNLDTSFGGSGIVATDFDGKNDSAQGLVIQADGKIVVAGIADVGGDDDFALARYNADGNLDGTFSFGLAITDFGSGNDYGYALAIQPDGKVVVAGTGWYETTPFRGSYDLALARYNPNGTLDAGFGAGGKVRTGFGGKMLSTDVATAVAIQPDGKIVAAGYSDLAGNVDFVLARYNPNGSLDTTFGGGTGSVTTDFTGGADKAAALVLAPGGKIVVVGSSTGGADFAVARYNADGSPDASFDGDGKVTTGFGGNASASAVVLQTDGKIVVAGCGARVVGASTDFALARYNANGSLDATFGTSGQVTTGFGPGGDCAYAVSLNGPNRIVAGGSADNGSHNDFAVARYFGTTIIFSAPCCDFDGSGAIDVAEIQFVAARWRWGQYDPLIDVVPDGKLTIQDVMKVAANYGGP